MLVTDWESLTAYHTGDLVTRWSSDASNISSGILNWIPNLIIYTFRFISALAIVVYYDPTFAFFALLGIPFSALLSRPLLRRMRDNNQRSAAMNAKLYGFNQEAFSNIQTIKAFDLIHFYMDQLKNLQKDYINMSLDFQKMSIDLCSDVHYRFYRIVQLLWLGNLPCVEQCDQLRNHDHVSVSVRHADKCGQILWSACSFCDLTDDLCRPTDGYRGNAPGGLQPGFCCPQASKSSIGRRESV